MAKKLSSVMYVNKSMDEALGGTNSRASISPLVRRPID